MLVVSGNNKVEEPGNNSKVTTLLALESAEYVTIL